GPLAALALCHASTITEPYADGKRKSPRAERHYQRTSERRERKPPPTTPPQAAGQPPRTGTQAHRPRSESSSVVQVRGCTSLSRSMSPEARCSACQGGPGTPLRIGKAQVRGGVGRPRTLILSSRALEEPV